MQWIRSGLPRVWLLRFEVFTVFAIRRSLDIQEPLSLLWILHLRTRVGAVANCHFGCMDSASLQLPNLLKHGSRI